jgi:hypothetical protein
MQGEADRRQGATALERTHLPTCPRPVEDSPPGFSLAGASARKRAYPGPCLSQCALITVMTTYGGRRQAVELGPKAFGLTAYFLRQPPPRNRPTRPWDMFGL